MVRQFYTKKYLIKDVTIKENIDFYTPIGGAHKVNVSTRNPDITITIEPIEELKTVSGTMDDIYKYLSTNVFYGQEFTEEEILKALEKEYPERFI